jgi:hypothetical protein
MTTEENKKTRFAALLTTGAVGLFFLGSSAFLYVDNNDLKEENKIATQQVETLSSVRDQLQSDLKSIDAELSKYKGRSEELDYQLLEAQKDLKAKKKKIQKLLKQNASIEKLKKEAKSLRKLKDTYTAQVEELQRKNGLLSNENKDLKNDNERLKSELQTISNNYMVLERKVEIASILKVDNVLASAEKKTKKGSYSKASGPKKTDRFMINFELSENRVADQGNKDLHIRIIDPSGNVLPASGSEKGSFSNADGNMDLPYSVKKTIDYNNQKIKSSVTYETSNIELKEGTYTLEFYCEGYFCGASKYSLK